MSTMYESEKFTVDKYILVSFSTGVWVASKRSIMDGLTVNIVTYYQN